MGGTRAITAEYTAATAIHTDITRGTTARNRPPSSPSAVVLTRPCSVTATLFPPGDG
ncbi:hypothetical protein GCM10022226_79460 [Sphaerisporangium flaviroseum]|uniref:Uncharacterized protein n=1 Tax=Sphaerisporangium flaviroseum TaxID=509199 RepID=A0ABP7JH84_9ACTN